LTELKPDRLGHAVFLTPDVAENIVRTKRPIEICLTSNLKVGSIRSLEEHHFKWAVNHQVPVLISVSKVQCPLSTFQSTPIDMFLGLLDETDRRYFGFWYHTQ
jgi:hypothetical protein